METNEVNLLVPMLAKLSLRHMDMQRRANVLRFMCEKHQLSPEQLYSIVARTKKRRAAQTLRYLISALDDDRVDKNYKTILSKLGVQL